MPEKLFAVVLGGYAPRCNTELHDVVFVVGESLESTYPLLLQNWFGTPESCHVDAWAELAVVDGFRVRLDRNPVQGAQRLYFINLGAYDPRHFGELHACAFLVSDHPRKVRERARAELLAGKVAVHTDELFEVDDCLELTEVDGRHVHLEAVDESPPLEFHNEYLVIPREVVKRFIAARGEGAGA